MRLTDARSLVNNSRIKNTLQNNMNMNKVV